jgi:hypothetical protein
MDIEVEGFTCTEVVGIYHIENLDAKTPRDMCVIVEKIAGRFVAHCNYSLQTKKMMEPYQSGSPSKTKDAAVSSLLNNFRPFLREDLDNISWEPQKPILGG